MKTVIGDKGLALEGLTFVSCILAAGLIATLDLSLGVARLKSLVVLFSLCHTQMGSSRKLCILFQREQNNIMFTKGGRVCRDSGQLIL